LREKEKGEEGKRERKGEEAKRERDYQIEIQTKYMKASFQRRIMK
jgi:hypothetical protein